MLINESPSNKLNNLSLDDLDDTTRKALEAANEYFDKNPPRASTQKEIQDFLNSF